MLQNPDTIRAITQVASDSYAVIGTAVVQALTHPSALQGTNVLPHAKQTLEATQDLLLSDKKRARRLRRGKALLIAGGLVALSIAVIITMAFMFIPSLK